ncbi:MAG: hypothetical protein KDA37_04750 [Planctomycetales bacterium]|nr:hypothetical protein [Planctomycetales bacterium]
MSMILRTLAVAALALSAGAGGAQPLNVLFYGNSFTLGFGSTRSVNAVFQDIATAAGHETPLAQSAAASGQTLNWHLNNNTNPIFTLIPPGRDWDYIVLQEHSTKFTQAFAESPPYPQSIEQSKADAVGLYDRATDRSPNVTPILYETWARGPGHEFYTGPNPLYSGPSEMQAEIRSGYQSLKQAIDESVGSDLALIAPVGDAWENANYDQLHANDLWHAQNRGTLLAALVIYGTAYGDPTTSDIDLSGVLASMNLTAADGAFLTAAADRTLAPVPEPASISAVVGGCIAFGCLKSRPRCRNGTSPCVARRRGCRVRRAWRPN